ncbi:integrase catalytic domain-containing protein, partial [Streptomyces neyagawaensis]|uniref:integrase catalytic domain-containing protein n=1 Tax=Streptomyces neyagawaensis TaxID=42238 RepID=UPI00201CCF64
MGKQHRASFKTKQNFQVTEPLYMLHMDLFGPVNVQTPAGKKYTIVIVVEFSRFSWVIFLRSKSDAAPEIISFIKQMELKFSKKVCQLRSDNGTEFRNVTLESFCADKGISQNFSSARTPEQNGVVERKNRTLIEAAR